MGWKPYRICGSVFFSKGTVFCGAESSLKSCCENPTLSKRYATEYVDYVHRCSRSTRAWIRVPLVGLSHDLEEIMGFKA